MMGGGRVPAMVTLAFACLAANAVQAQTPAPRPPPQLRSNDAQQKLAPPTTTPEDDRLFRLVTTQLVAAAVVGVVLAPLAWGGPFVVAQSFAPPRDVDTGARILLVGALVAAPLFASAVGLMTSVAGSVFGRGKPPHFRALLAGASGGLTAGLCAGGLAATLFASVPLAGAAVLFWIVGLPITAVGGAAVGAVTAVYLEGRALSASPPPSSPAPAMRF